MKTKQDFVNKIHLVISIIIVIPAALIYGFEPKLLLDMYAETVDERNFHMAIMGLYLVFSLLWILGITKEDYFKLALISNIIFMSGLAFGRILSIFLDGLPTSFYLYGTIGELVLGVYGVYVLSKLSKNPNFAIKSILLGKNR